MKLFSAILVTLASSFASAASVRVDSFTMIQNGMPLAELCATIENPTSATTAVQVISDPRIQKPGFYNTFAMANGKFCLTFVTYTRFAEIVIGSEVVTAQVHQK